MPRILVTPLSALEDAIAKPWPSHIVTLLVAGAHDRDAAGFAADGI